ncbi:hypothetical protein LTR17_009490 [Elasticomyces elasticus]|nr:hypothetical protein LTR17_009490 [Elasticomyces elasticus]
MAGQGADHSLVGLRFEILEDRKAEVAIISLQHGDMGTVVSDRVSIVNGVSLQMDDGRRGTVMKSSVVKAKPDNPWREGERVRAIKDAAEVMFDIDVTEGRTGRILYQRGKKVKVEMENGTVGYTSMDVVMGQGGWPYVANQAWDPEVERKKNSQDYETKLALKNAIPIRQHDEGEVIAYSDDLKWSEVSVPSRGLQGWVPTLALHKTFEAPYAQPARLIHHDILADIGADVDVEAIDEDSDGAFETAVRATAEALWEKKDHLICSSASHLLAISTPARRMAVANVLIRGVNEAGLLDLFNADDTTLEDLMEAGQDANMSHRTAIYLRNYFDMLKATNKPRRKTTIYLGSAVDSQVRQSGHNTKLRQGKSGKSHCAAFKDARQNKNIILCFLPGPDDPAHYSTELLEVVEQILMILVGTYTKHYRNMATKERHTKKSLGMDGPNGPESAVKVSDAVAKAEERIDEDVEEENEEEENEEEDSDEEEEDEDDEDDDDEDDDEEEKEEKDTDKDKGKVSATQLFDSALCFLRATAPALVKAGWTPMASRPSFFLGCYGECDTLNKQSPMTSQIRRQIWTKTVLPAERLVQWRRGFNCTSFKSTHGTKRSKRFGYFGCHGSYVRKVFGCGEDKGGPPVGAKVYMVMEATTDGRPHPMHYCRAPSVCLYEEDAAIARTLAIRAEWEDDGEWFYEYQFASSTSQDTYSTQVPGSHISVGQARGILNTLQRRYFANHRSWDVPYGPVRIMDVAFDNLARTVTVQEDASMYLPINTGQPRTEQDMIDDLANAGAQRLDAGHPITMGAYNTHTGVLNPAITKGNALRKSCDRCVVAVWYDSRTKKSFNLPGPVVSMCRSSAIRCTTAEEDDDEKEEKEIEDSDDEDSDLEDSDSEDDEEKAPRLPSWTHNDALLEAELQCALWYPLPTEAISGTMSAPGYVVAASA